VCGNILADYARRAAAAKGATALPPAEVLPWADLRYLIGSIAYGGHVTDAFGAWRWRGANRAWTQACAGCLPLVTHHTALTCMA
jgi:hypothetical protein